MWHQHMYVSVLTGCGGGAKVGSSHGRIGDGSIPFSAHASPRKPAAVAGQLRQPQQRQGQGPPGYSQSFYQPMSTYRGSSQ